MPTLTELRTQARRMEPHVRIGKNGLTATVVEEVKQQLKKHKLVKVKFLKALLETQDKQLLAFQLATKTAAQIIERIGSIVVLYREK